jgi:hypothetical protein
MARAARGPERLDFWQSNGSHVLWPQEKTMLRTTALALSLAIGVLLAQGASAMSLRELRTLEKNEKQGEVYALYYLVGVLEGALEAQAKTVRLGAKPNFCLLGRRLEPRMARELFDTELRRQADLYEADMPAQLVLLNALGTVYSCN